MRTASIVLAVIAIMLAIISISLSTRAHAQIIMTPGAQDGWSLSGPNGTTIMAPLGSASPHIIHVTPHEGSDEDKAWEKYCQPKLQYGDFGVQHYVYAKPGCEFGRTHD